ncbi:LIM domain transcription factor LMO4.2 isoform X2 [Prorops nasuta]|uniref:LIM domain transcription factor LMO4.2 isoform X2 n=1 Tax=Prorops nasuta TaxID=863751 RepID=UPI0034CF816C
MTYFQSEVSQGIGSNGHHHHQPGPQQGSIMPDHQHHPGHSHSHIPAHPAYSSVNHNNNCTLKQEGGPSGPNGIQQCAGCGGQIMERWLLFAMERYWHNGCLKCSYCGAALAEIARSCYFRSGMILCRNDYRRMFGNSGACSSCGSTIPANELVMRAGASVFHLKCFTCTKCGGALVSGDRYYLLSGSPVCETDWHKIMKSSSMASAAATTAAAGNGGAPVRKGKVGRPRRSRE